MKKTFIWLITVVVLAIAGFMGYQYLTQPELAPVPPIPAASTTVTPEVITAENQDILVIEIAGETSGTIEILLNSEIAPGHVARIKTLAKAGAYDNVVFHRVIEGFMAQTGDVQFGKRDGSTERAGMGGSTMSDLKAEFSDQKFVRGVVGMARSNNPDSANSQFFIMFDEAASLNGAYTIVGRVISGMDVVDAIKKGAANQNGSVSNPDYMRSVTIKEDE